MKTSQTLYVSGLMVVGAMLIASALPVTAQDFTVRMKDQDGKIAVHYVSRNAVRNVASNPVETDVIYCLDTGKIITLNHQKKTYTELTLAQARERFEKAMTAQQATMRRLGMNVGTVSITKIGPGETIAGYATERYATKTPMTQGEVWIAPALEVPPAYYDIATTHAAAQMGVMDQIVKEMREKRVKGYLLKSVGTANMPMMKGVSFTQVTTSVEKGPIPKSTFEPPAGYRKVEAQ
jgi:hypothetical protein